MMHPYVQEAIFATALTVGLIWAYKTIPTGLQEVKDAARSPLPEDPSAPPTKQLDPDAEDKIELSTLQVLSEGHSFELRNAAIKIISARAVNDENRRLLLRDLRSKNYQRQDNAINALWLLFHGPEGQEHVRANTLSARFQDHEAFEAIIQALINILPYHKHPKSEKDVMPPSPIKPFPRPVHELSLLRLLAIALRGSQRTHLGMKDTQFIDVALDAGLVTHWLCNYPFPCSLPQYARYNYKKSDVCALFGSGRYASDDVEMHEIIRLVSSCARGNNQLRAAGLKVRKTNEDLKRLRTERRYRAASDGGTPVLVSTPESLLPHPPSETSGIRSPAESEVDQDVRMVDGEDTAGQPIVNWTPIRTDSGSGMEEDWRNEAHPRLQERSQEEVSLRRRNREAIVVAERGQPLGQENILRRGDSQSGGEELPPWVTDPERFRSEREIVRLLEVRSGLRSLEGPSDEETLDAEDLALIGITVENSAEHANVSDLDQRHVGGGGGGGSEEHSTS